MNMRRGFWFLVPASALALLALLHMAPAGPADANTTETTITAVLVKSWSACPPPTSLTIWDELNSRWSDYGTIPIVIDTDHPQLCPGPFTYADLVSSGADVIILSNPAGGVEQYSPDEIAALEQYALDGHRLIGTFMLMQDPSHPAIDNRGLAPLFGLPASASYGSIGLPSPAYTLLQPSHALFAGMSNPYSSAGYAVSQVPADNSWDTADLDGAEILAQTSDSRGVILAYYASTYDAIYITSMPEYGGNTQDERFLYNALTRPLHRSSFMPLVLRRS